jgi:hypothetical protein
LCVPDIDLVQKINASSSNLINVIAYGTYLLKCVVYLVIS